MSTHAAPAGGETTEKAQLRVALFTDADVFAGTERHMLDLARALRDEGVAVCIACPIASPLADKSRAEKIEVVPLAKRGLLDWTAVRILRRLLKSGRIDIIHAHNGRTALAGALAVKLARRGNAIATQHFLEPNHASQSGLKGAVSGRAHGWVAAHTQTFVAISEAVRQTMLKRGEAPGEKITTVLNGLSEPDASTLSTPDAVRKSLGIAPDALFIVCAARLEREKEIGSLVEAMAEVVQTHPDAICCVAGQGAQKDELLARIDTLRLNPNVRLLGFRDDVLSLIGAAELFVLPSPAEPFGLVLLEAMALGVPVIATSAGGPLEIVSHNESGLLVPPSDAHALAEAINELLDNPQQRQAMGKAGRARFEERFTARRMAREIKALYETIRAA